MFDLEKAILEKVKGCRAWDWGWLFSIYCLNTKVFHFVLLKRTSQRKNRNYTAFGLACDGAGLFFTTYQNPNPFVHSLSLRPVYIHIHLLAMPFVLAYSNAKVYTIPTSLFRFFVRRLQ